MHVGVALRSLGHVGGAQFPPRAQVARSAISNERAQRPGNELGGAGLVKHATWVGLDFIISAGFSRG